MDKSYDCVKMVVTVDGEMTYQIDSTLSTTDIYFLDTEYSEKKELNFVADLKKLIKKFRKFPTFTIDVLHSTNGSYTKQYLKSYRIIDEFGILKDCEMNLSRNSFDDFQPIKSKDIYKLITQKIDEYNSFAYEKYLEKL